MNPSTTKQQNCTQKATILTKSQKYKLTQTIHAKCIRGVEVFKSKEEYTSFCVQVCQDDDLRKQFSKLSCSGPVKRDVSSRVKTLKKKNWQERFWKKQSIQLQSKVTSASAVRRLKRRNKRYTFKIRTLKFFRKSNFCRNKKAKSAILSRMYRGVQLQSLFLPDDVKPYIRSLLEDLIVCIYNISNAIEGQRYLDIFIHITTFIKARTGKSVFQFVDFSKFVTTISDLFQKLIKYVKNLFPSNQSDSLEEAIDNKMNVLDSLIGHFHLIKHSKFVSKLGGCLAYLIALPIFDSLGARLNCEKSLKVIRKSVIKEKLFCGADLVTSMIDLVIFVCQRGWQCYKMGSMQPMFHSGETYIAWAEKAQDIITKSRFLGNPEAHGIDEHTFLSDLNILINQGECIRKTVAGDASKGAHYITKIYSDLVLVKHNLITLESAQKERMTPLGVLIDGGTSIAKSSFAKMLFYHYANVRGKSKDDHFRHTRNSLDEFWSGFRSSQWCIHLDDVSAYKAAVCPEGDPSVKELIQVINQIPYNPNQAELSDKGKTPVRAELVTASTNTYHLNVNDYYEFPLAVQRRLPIVIRLKVKPEYESNLMVDFAKIPEHMHSEYPDFWHIEVYKILPNFDGDNLPSRGRYEPTYAFDSIYDFLNWFTYQIREHYERQQVVLKNMAHIKELPICKVCFLPGMGCVCDGHGEIVRKHNTHIDSRAKPTNFGPETRTVFWGSLKFDLNNSTQCNTYNEICSMSNEDLAIQVQSDIEEVHRYRIIVEWVEGSSIYPDVVAHRDVCLAMPSMCDMIWSTDDDFKLLALLGNMSRSPRRHMLNLDLLEEYLHEYVRGLTNMFMDFRTVALAITNCPNSPLATILSRYGIKCLYMNTTACNVQPDIDGLLHRAYSEYLGYVFGTTNVIEPEPLVGSNTPLLRLYNHVKGPVLHWDPEGHCYTNMRQVFRHHYLESLRIADLAEFTAKQAGVSTLSKINRFASNCFWNGLYITEKYIPGVQSIGNTLGTSQALHSIAAMWTCYAYGARNGVMKSIVRELKLIGDKMLSLTLTSTQAKVLSGIVTAAIAAKAMSGLFGMMKAWYYARKPAPQADMETTGKTPKPTAIDKDRKNIWYKQVVDMDPSNFPSSKVGLKNMSLYDAKRLIANNVRSIQVVHGNNSMTTFNALGLVGQYYVTTLHSVKAGGGTAFVCRFPKESNHLGTVSIPFTNDNVVLTDGELCVIKLPSLPPVRDIRPFLSKNLNFGCYKGGVLTRQRDGKLRDLQIDCIEYQANQNWGTTEIFNGWTGKFTSDCTIRGDCGAPWIVETSFGPTILGIHVALHEDSSRGWCVALDERILDCITEIIPNEGPLNGGEVTLQVLSERSTINYCETGSAHIYGSLSSHGNTFKSEVSKTLIAPYFEERGYVPTHLPPPFKEGASTWNAAVQNNLDIKHHVLTSEVNVAVKEYTQHVLKQLSTQDLSILGVITQDVAMNGAPGVVYIDRLNPQTSGGFGNPGKKIKHLELISEGEYKLNKVDKERLQKVDDCYNNNTTYKPVFIRFPKDEALPLEKVLVKKQFRTISCGPMVWNTWIRMHYLTFIKLMQHNKFKFMCAPGMVCQGREWEELFAYLTQFGTDHIVAGDYSKFDQKMPAEIIKGAMDIIHVICEASGQYSDEELRKMRVAAYDFAFPVYISKGDAYQPYGSNSSGNPLTVVINCLCNIIILHIAYQRLKRMSGQNQDFFENVALMVYGDDNIYGVSNNMSWYNHTSISEAISTMGMSYTMADKSSESVPFSSIYDVEFLKRKFYKHELGLHTAALAESSILKSLNIGIKSKSICAEKHAICVMSSAHSEYFFHGKEKFDDWCGIKNDIIARYNLDVYATSSYFPSWDQLVERFHDISSVAELWPRPGMSQNYPERDSSPLSD